MNTKKKITKKKATKKPASKKAEAKKSEVKKPVTKKTLTKKITTKKSSVQVNRSAQRARSAQGDEKFFSHLAQTGRPIESAQFAGYSRAMVYKRKKDEPDFAEQWDVAKETYIESFEKYIDKRALKGYKDPVFHSGVKVGSRRKFSDSLALARLKVLAPEKYSERQRLEQDNNQATSDTQSMTPIIKLTLNGNTE